jgi:cytochrome P450
LQPRFLVSGPAGVERILQSNQHNYRGFDYSHEILRPLLGNGLLTSEGEIWRKHRRLAQQAFHKEQLEQLSGIMVSSVQRFLETWSDSWRPGRAGLIPQPLWISARKWDC